MPDPNNPEWRKKAYLGDGAFVQRGAWKGQVLLTAENGVMVTNQVALEGLAIQLLIDWLKEHGFLGVQGDPDGS